MSRSYFVAIPLFLLMAAVQTTIFTYVQLLGETVQLTTLIALSWVLIRDLEEGIVWGFLAGVVLDLYSYAPTGTHMLSVMMAVALVALIQAGLPQNRFVLAPILCGLGCVVALLIQATLIEIAGFTADWSILPRLPLFGIAQAISSIPVYWSLYYLGRILYPPQVEQLS